MPFELYMKPGFGRRLRRVSSTAGMKHVMGNLWSSLGGAVAPAAPTATLTGNLPLLGDGATAITIELAGGFPLAAAKTATVSFNAGTLVTKAVPLAKGDTADQAATKIVAASGLWNADVAATKGPSAVVVTPATGKTLTALAVTFA